MRGPIGSASPFDVQDFRAQEESRENKWTEDPTGGSYLGRLGSRYGPDIQKRLDDFKRQELVPAIRQSIDRNLAAPVDQTVGVAGKRKPTQSIAGKSGADVEPLSTLSGGGGRGGTGSAAEAASG